MRQPLTHNKTSLNRRRFISNTVRLLVLGSIFPLQEACNNKSSKHPAGPGKDSTAKKSQGSKKTPNNRKKWMHEGLVMNTQTHVMHFPTSKVYTYYDEIKPTHLREISLVTWVATLQGPVRLNREQSGNILEILTLQHLKQGVNDEYLNAATDTLAKAFTPAGENSKAVNLNTMNFRLHELMLQLLSLNTSIPDKWQVFNSKVKKSAILRKRQKWMETETGFNDRVKYIMDHQSDYMNRLTARARKYSFT